MRKISVLSPLAFAAAALRGGERLIRIQCVVVGEHAVVIVREALYIQENTHVIEGVLLFLWAAA